MFSVDAHQGAKVCSLFSVQCADAVLSVDAPARWKGGKSVECEDSKRTPA